MRIALFIAGLGVSIALLWFSVSALRNDSTIRPGSDLLPHMPDIYSQEARGDLFPLN